MRLVFSTLLFLVYGGSTAYFNYYVHTVNSEAVDMFFILNYRTIYTTSAGLFLKEAISKGNAQLVSHYTGTDGQVYLLDLLDRLLIYEAKTSSFKKYASSFVYRDYLALLERSDGDEFCAVSDSYNYSQAIRILIFHISLMQ